MRVEPGIVAGSEVMHVIIHALIPPANLPAENEEGEWSDEEGEVMPAKKQRQPPAANGAAAAKPPLIPRKQPHVPATKKDVAFDAVAMEDDSDDDVPLAQRGR